jgi:hypothetical protein
MSADHRHPRRTFCFVSDPTPDRSLEINYFKQQSFFQVHLLSESVSRRFKTLKKATAPVTGTAALNIFSLWSTQSLRSVCIAKWLPVDQRCAFVPIARTILHLKSISGRFSDLCPTWQPLPAQTNQAVGRCC